MGHERLVRLVRPMNTTSRILGEAMTPRQKRIYKDPEKAVAWATKHGQRFPEAEAAIANDPFWAYSYAKAVLKGRWPEVEEAIATNPHLAKSYLELFPEAKLEWLMNGWIDWLDL